MAAGDFTASEFPNLLIALEDVMTGEGPLQREKEVDIETLRVATEGQSVRIDPILTSSGQCREVDAWFMANGSQRHVYSGTEADATQGCAIAPGVELEALGKNLKNNYVVKSAFVASSKRCDNASTWAMEVAKGIRDCMADNRRQLKNLHYYPLLVASVGASEHTATSLTDIVVDGVTGHYKADPALWSAELALKINLLAQQNYMGNYILLNGSNFYFDEKIQQYKRLNDDSRDSFAIYGNVPMAWDVKDLDAIAGEQETFLLDRNMFAFWNSSWYSDTPVLVDSSQNKYLYRVMDPVLRWNDNGTLRPVYHHIESEYTCTSRDVMDEPVYGWTYNVTLIGGIHMAPVGFNYPTDTATAPTQTRTGVIGIRNKA